jgi:hypothetical protein
MIGDISYISVCNEECSLWYFSERSTLSKVDTDEMYPYERQIVFDMFKKFDKEIEENMKKQQAKTSGGKTTTTAW